MSQYVRWDLGADITRRRDYRDTATTSRETGLIRQPGTEKWIATVGGQRIEFATKEEAERALIEARLAPPAASGGFFGIPTMYLLIGGAGIAAFLFLRKKKSS